MKFRLAARQKSVSPPLVVVIEPVVLSCVLRAPNDFKSQIALVAASNCILIIKFNFKPCLCALSGTSACYCSYKSPGLWFYFSCLPSSFAAFALQSLSLALLSAPPPAALAAAPPAKTRVTFSQTHFATIK